LKPCHGLFEGLYMVQLFIVRKTLFDLTTQESGPPSVKAFRTSLNWFFIVPWVTLFDCVVPPCFQGKKDLATPIHSITKTVYSHLCGVYPMTHGIW